SCSAFFRSGPGGSLRTCSVSALPASLSFFKTAALCSYSAFIASMACLTCLELLVIDATSTSAMPVECVGDAGRCAHSADTLKTATEMPVKHAAVNDLLIGSCAPCACVVIREPRPAMQASRHRETGLGLSSEVESG